MVRKFLLILIACCFGVGWITANASADSELRNKVGECNSIVAHGAGLVGKVNQGVGDEEENCTEAFANLVEFALAGCLPPPDGVVPFGSLYIQKIFLTAPDTPALQNLCSAAVDICGIPLMICPEE
jgi:hypothetical protein